MLQLRANVQVWSNGLALNTHVVAAAFICLLESSRTPFCVILMQAASNVTSSLAELSYAQSTLMATRDIRRAIDPASGRAYYYDRHTRVTSWSPPPGTIDESKIRLNRLAWDATPATVVSAPLTAATTVASHVLSRTNRTTAPTSDSISQLVDDLRDTARVLVWAEDSTVIADVVDGVAPPRQHRENDDGDADAELPSVSVPLPMDGESSDSGSRTERRHVSRVEAPLVAVESIPAPGSTSRSGGAVTVATTPPRPRYDSRAARLRGSPASSITFATQPQPCRACGRRFLLAEDARLHSLINCRGRSRVHGAPHTASRAAAARATSSTSTRRSGRSTARQVQRTPQQHDEVPTTTATAAPAFADPAPVEADAQGGRTGDGSTEAHDALPMLVQSVVGAISTPILHDNDMRQSATSAAHDDAYAPRTPPAPRAGLALDQTSARDAKSTLSKARAATIEDMSGAALFEAAYAAALTATATLERVAVEHSGGRSTSAARERAELSATSTSDREHSSETDAMLARVERALQAAEATRGSLLLPPADTAVFTFGSQRLLVDGEAWSAGKPRQVEVHVSTPVGTPVRPSATSSNSGSSSSSSSSSMTVPSCKCSACGAGCASAVELCSHVRECAAWFNSLLRLNNSDLPTRRADRPPAPMLHLGPHVQLQQHATARVTPASQPQSTSLIDALSSAPLAETAARSPLSNQQQSSLPDRVPPVLHTVVASSEPTTVATSDLRVDEVPTASVAEDIQVAAPSSVAASLPIDAPAQAPVDTKSLLRAALSGDWT